jgi:hypothetical protein
MILGYDSGVMTVFVVTALKKEGGLGTQAPGGKDWHGALDAKLPGFIAAGSHNPPLSIAANDQRFAFQRRVFQ